MALCDGVVGFPFLLGKFPFVICVIGVLCHCLDGSCVPGLGPGGLGDSLCHPSQSLLSFKRS